MSIDKETEKRLYEEGKSDDYILGYERGEYDTKQKLKSELEIKETNIRFSNKVIEDLSIDMDYLKADRETWKKIAEKLAYEILLKTPFGDMSEENIKILIDEVRKEVEANETHS